MGVRFTVADWSKALVPVFFLREPKKNSPAKERMGEEIVTNHRARTSPGNNMITNGCQEQVKFESQGISDCSDIKEVYSPI